MTYHWTPSIIPLIAAAIISVAAAFRLLRARTPQNITAGLALLAMAEVMLGYALEMAGADMATTFFWNRAQSVGWNLLYPAWLLFTFYFTGRERWVTRRTLILLSIMPLVTLVLTFTNEMHHLVMSAAALDAAAPIPVLEQTLGPWGGISVLYANLMLLFSFFLLVQALLRAPAGYRWPIVTLLAGPIVPGIGLLLDLTGLNPFIPVSAVPFAIGITGLSASWAIFSLQIGDIVPLAREAAFEGMSDPVIVLDAGDQIADINPAAEGLIGCEAAQAFGKPIAQVWPQWISRLNALRDMSVEGLESTLEVGGAQYTYDVHVSPLRDRRRRLTGRAIVLRNVTGRERMAQDLQRSVTELQDLQHITESLLSLDDLPQIMQTMAEGIVTRLGYEYTIIVRYHEEGFFSGLAFHPLSDAVSKVLGSVGKILRQPAWKGDVSALRLPYQSGMSVVVDRVLDDGELVITDAVSDLMGEIFPPVAIPISEKILGGRTHILVPMRVGGKTVGHIHAAAPKGFPHAERQPALLRIAGQAALAVAKAQLYEAEQQRAAELERQNAFTNALLQVVARVEAGSTPEQVMETLGVELHNLELDYIIMTLEPDKQALIFDYSSVDKSAISAIQKLTRANILGLRIPRDRWLSDEIIDQKQPLYESDPISGLLALYPGVPEALLKRVIKLAGMPLDVTAFYLPLVVEEQAVGIMAVWGARMLESDLPSLSVFANQVAVTLEKARLVAAEQQRAAELERSNILIGALSRVAASLEATLNLDEVLETLGAELNNLAMGNMLWMLDPEDESLIMQHTSVGATIQRTARKMMKVEMLGFRIPPERWKESEPFRITIEQQQPFFTPDPISEIKKTIPKIPRRVIERVFQLAGLPPKVMGAHLPLMVNEQVTGLLVVWGVDLKESDAPALSIFASQMAVALEKAQLFEAEQQRAAELARSNALITALGQVAARIETALDPDQVLETLGIELRKLGFTYFLGLLEPGTDKLVGRFVSIDPAALKKAENLMGITVCNLRIPANRWPAMEDMQPGQATFIRDPLSETAAMFPSVPKNIYERVVQWAGVNLDAGSISIPLSVKEHMFGVLSVWGSALREEDAPPLTIFAGQVAGALERARLYEIERQRTEDLTRVGEKLENELAKRTQAQARERRLREQQIAVNRMALELGETRYLTEVYPIIYEHVSNLLDSDMFIISSYDQETQFIRAVFASLNDVAQDVVDYPPIPLGPEGIQSQVIRSGVPLNLPDLLGTLEKTNNQYTVHDNGTISEGISFYEDDAVVKSALMVPMQVAGQIVGVMQVQSYRLSAYSQEDEALLAALANVTAIAIENARLFEQAQEELTERVQAEARERRLREQQVAVNRLALNLGATRDLAEVYPIIYEHVSNLLDANMFIISAYDQETKLIRAAFASLDDVAQDIASLPPIPLGSEGTQSQVIRNVSPLNLPDLQTALKKSQTHYSVKENGTVSDGPPPPEAGDEYTKSALFVPMQVAGQVVGVMQVQSYRLHAYSLEDEDLLTALANMAAISIENARLFDEHFQAEERTKKYIKRLRSLHQIDQAITGSLDLDVTLQILLDHLVEQLEVDAAAVLLYNKALQTLDFSQGQGFHTIALQHTHLRWGKGHAGKVALERRHIYIPDLNQSGSGIQGSPEFAEEDFVVYYGSPLIAKGVLVGVLEIFHRSTLTPDDEWENYLHTLAEQAAIAIDNLTLFNDLQHSNIRLTQAYDATIEGWAQALELRDMETEGHSKRVVDLTLELARRLNICDEELVHIRRGAFLHDIGKMGVPDAILRKPGKLTDKEWEVMRQHPVYAHKWLSSIEYLRPALHIPYCHHERWDGTGYPRRLKGIQIPVAARIFSVVDVWDALLSDRPYRKAWSREKALAYIKEQSGKLFDPDIIEIFLQII